MMTAAGALKNFPRISLVLITLLLATVISADCITDLRGETYCGAGHCKIDSEGTVWCSRYYEGGAEITLEGQVLCGIGQCVTDGEGQAFCSSEIGGAVLINSRGHVRCYGQCEPASKDYCESTHADSAG